MQKTNLIRIYSFILMGIVLMIIVSCNKDDEINPVEKGAVTDIDGNVYHSVTIGTQVWMVENLKVTKYRNGDPIPNVTPPTTWGALTTGAYCWYNNDAVANKATNGALYNWYAVADSRNIAPTGWHVPTDTEWITLTTYLSGDAVAGGKLKETGIINWQSPNNEATNSSGFTALPGGGRGSILGFLSVGSIGNWWTSSESTSPGAMGRGIFNRYPILSRFTAVLADGLSVRCIKD